MDYEFPRRLFPSHFNTGPPSSFLKHNVGKWGSYEHVLDMHTGSIQTPDKHDQQRFSSKHLIKQWSWGPSEPVVVPLLSPGPECQWFMSNPDPVDFTKHMQNFYIDNHKDAFHSMSSILGEHMEFERIKRKKAPESSVYMWRAKAFMNRLKYQKCEVRYPNHIVIKFEKLWGDLIHDIPPELLADLLCEELSEQKDMKRFTERSTGGSLAFIPFTGASTRSSQHGCLICPGNYNHYSLDFHKLVLKTGDSMPPRLVLRDQPLNFKLKGPARQITFASLLNESYVAVRSDYLCGVWRAGECLDPELLQVIRTKQATTCISCSPHVPGEMLVASESGAVHLWTVGTGLQKCRQEESNIYFNARSQWRWCEFSAHPRVIVYTDRTGTELTDVRCGSSHTLFRIGQTPDCRSRERVILTRYLRDVHSFHHLITTQNSAYIMDERFPCIPMLKWDHMMEYPPLFSEVVRGPISSCSATGEAGTTRVLLGSQASQEIVLFQYAGGRSETCISLGPPQALLRPRDSLNHLPVQLPHRHETMKSRLALPAAGLTCIQKGEGGSSEETLCVLQLTEAGDVFYQILTPQWAEAQATRSQPRQIHLPEMVSETQQCKMDEMIGPTQDLTGQDFVPETPEKEQLLPDVTKTGRRRRTMSEISCNSTEYQESKARHRDLARLGLEVVFNDESDPDQRHLVNTEVEEQKSGNASLTFQVRNENSSSAHGVGPNVPTSKPSAVKLSDKMLLKWRRWLLKLVKQSCKNKDLQNKTIKTKDLAIQSNTNNDPYYEEAVKILRRDMKSCMMKDMLFLHSATYLQPLEQFLILNPVKIPNKWINSSQLLAQSHENQSMSGNLWGEESELSKEEQVEALRRKRKRQKEAKRSRQHPGSFGSFTSSTSYQFDFDDSSSCWGSSSVTNHALLPEDNEFMSQSESLLQPDSTSEVLAATSQSAEMTSIPQALQQPYYELRRSARLHNSSHSVSQHDVTSVDITSMHRPQDCLDSQEELTILLTDPTVAAQPSNPIASIGVPLKTMKEDLSQTQTEPSQQASVSQLSEGRMRLSQSLRPQKKRHRMGF